MKNIVTKGALLAGAMLMFGVAAHAEPDYRDVVRDQRGNVVVNTFQNCVRTRWIENGDACGPKADYERLALEQRTLYFDFDKASLTPGAVAKLDRVLASFRGNPHVKGVKVVGYADRMGSAKYNEALSEKRANAVVAYLVQHGFAAASRADTRWLGESAPRTSCAEGLARAALISCLQPDRRVELEIEYVD